MHRIGALAAAILVCATSAGAAAAPEPGGVLLEGVTIVDPRDGSRAAGKDIYLVGGKIARIGARGSIPLPAGSQRVSARGKFVVPGYLDMHAHPLEPADAGVSLPLMVAYGVTGYRQMGGSPQLLEDRRAGRLPTGIVPELLETPGMVLAGPPAAVSPAAAAEEVRKQKAQGADFIKTVDLTPDTFFVALEEAHKLGMRYSGHLPPTIDIREAARRGMDSIEHLGPNTSLLISCSTAEPELRAAALAAASGPPRIQFDLPKEQLKRLTANPVMLGGPASLMAFRRLLDTYDEKKCRALAAELAAAATWQAPTLIRLKSMELGNDSFFRDDPDLQYIPKEDRALWLETGDLFSKRFNAEDQTVLRRLFERQLHVTKLLDDAGVKMLAGSDYGGIWLVAGPSLHHEFDLLAQAGLSPLRILQMTTVNGARFLGREATMGTVEVGKNADLVILDADPLAAAKNLHAIDGVVLKGRYLPKTELEGLKTSVAASVAVGAPGRGPHHH